MWALLTGHHLPTLEAHENEDKEDESFFASLKHKIEVAVEHKVRHFGEKLLLSAKKIAKLGAEKEKIGETLQDEEYEGILTLVRNSKRKKNSVLDF